MPGPRVRLTMLLAITTLILAGHFGCASLEFYMRTGSFSPQRIVEHLDQPIVVSGWNEEGLLTLDGQIIAVPGRIAPTSEWRVMPALIAQGVERAPDGRVYGLVRVHHWCGSDPVRQHVARVDIALVLEYLAFRKRSLGDAAVRFSQYGWNVSEFYCFQEWLKDRKSVAAEPAAS